MSGSSCCTSLYNLTLISVVSLRYIDRTMYLKTQPPDQRKKGFYSSDASRRDEFTLDIEVRHHLATAMQAHQLPAQT